MNLQNVSPATWAWIVLGLLVVISLAVMLFRKPRNWVEDRFFESFPAFDLAVGTFGTAMLTFVLYAEGYVDSVVSFLRTDGTSAYGAALSAFAALLGFGVAVLAIVCTVIPTTRFAEYLSDEQYARFWSAFTLTLRTLGTCTLISLVALFLNKAVFLREWLFLLFVLVISWAIPGMIRSALTLEVVVSTVRKSALAAYKKRHSKNKPVNP